jgi:hypothetical protein
MFATTEKEKIQMTIRIENITSINIMAMMGMMMRMLVRMSK